MAFLLKKARAGRYSGLHRSTRKGQSVEFADYRFYVAGDDFRQVDWHAYARLERLFIKLFMEENDLMIHLLVDTSGSMAWEESHKFLLAKQLAGALGYLALVMEQVGVIVLNQGANRFLPLQRGRNAISRLWGFLQQLEPGGETDLNISLRQAGKFIKGPGISIVLSDMFSPSGYQEGLKSLITLPMTMVAGVVSLGKKPMVEYPVDIQPDFKGLQVVLDPNYTDLAAGLRLARSIMPEERGKHIVLLTDGKQNWGNALEQAKLLNQQGTRMDVLPIATSSGPEVLVKTVEVPSRLKEGEFFDLKVALESTISTTALCGSW